MPINLKLNDLIQMKKPHPCGEQVWRVTRIGMDVRICCTRCGRELMLPRAKVEKSIKRVMGEEE